MKINIVWPTPGGDRILDRLARLLAKLTGWPLSERPDDHADLNYDMSYIDLAQRFTDWRRTPWAAYFSHYEKGTPYKEFWWNTAAPLTRIQTCTANQYMVGLSNPIKITPPVDPVFEIRERKPNLLPLIGVSGFVDRSGRKGEKLIARLASDLEGRAEIVASGEGWPARCISRGLDNLPAFYNSLDAYLCASTIEGVPMPPLEALRCGVPVIIPLGVGMLDEIADAPGVFRFEPGNYDDLHRAALLALEQCATLDREKLRSLASRYTPENFAQDHIKGLARAMGIGSSERHANMTTDLHGQRGVYYVAYGTPAMKCAIGAITSFRAFLPDIPVALVSERPARSFAAYRSMSNEDFEEAVATYDAMAKLPDVLISNPDEDIGGRAAKVKIYDLAPADWSYIAYVDSDTEIIAKETFIWNVIEDGWDMVICRNPARFHIASQMRRSDNGDECDYTFRQLGTDQLIQLNGGVFAFQRNDRTREFFHCWYQEWLRYGKRDQGALLRALNLHPVKLYVLGTEWNYITRYNEGQPAWLNHYPMTARRWRGVGHYRLDDPAAWKAVEEFERSKDK